MEVGLHVPGSASDQRLGRSVVPAASARCDPTQRSEMKKLGLIAALLFSVAPLSAQTRPRATVTTLVRPVHGREQVRLALRVTLPEGVHTQSNKPRDPSLIPTELNVDAPA